MVLVRESKVTARLCVYVCSGKDEACVCVCMCVCREEGVGYRRRGWDIGVKGNQVIQGTD